MNDKLHPIFFQRAFEKIQSDGFATIDLTGHPLVLAGPQIFKKLDDNYDSGQRGKYYNEISFNWADEWKDYGGIECFHEPITVESIYDFEKGKSLYNATFGESLSDELLKFINQVKESCISSHPDRENRKLRLGRVMLRQMGENEETNHRAHQWHEDNGYSDKPLLQYLTAAITLYGRPTEAERYNPSVGELLIFNNYHRRVDLNMPEELAFKHRGPKSGPKLFLFFEFLIPKT